MLLFMVKLPPHAKKLVLLGLDAVLVPLTLWCAFSWHYGNWHTSMAEVFLVSSVLVAVSLPIFMYFKVYRTVTRHIKDYGFWLMARAAVVSGAMLGVLTFVPVFDAPTPRSVFVIYAMSLFGWLAATRMTAAVMLGGGRSRRRGEPVAIYGADDSGRQLASTLLTGTDDMPMVSLDRVPALRGRSVGTLPVLEPNREDLVDVLADLGVREILLAIPGVAAQPVAVDSGAA